MKKIILLIIVGFFTAYGLGIFVGIKIGQYCEQKRAKPIITQVNHTCEHYSGDGF